MSPIALATVRSSHFLWAATQARCPGCGAATEVVALVLPPGHERREPPGEEDDIDEPAAEWTRSDAHAVVFLIRELSEAARSAAARAWPGFREAGDPGGGACHFSNHCAHCGARLEDLELHGEPDAAFMPSAGERAPRVRLLAINEPVEACADGYTHEPQFFDLMTRG